MTSLRKPLIVVPTYNEAENVDDLLAGIRRELPEAHVLFVDDASPDGTAERVRTQQERNPGLVHLLYREGKQGIGTAYVAGFTWALGRDDDAVVAMDADLSRDARAAHLGRASLGRRRGDRKPLRPRRRKHDAHPLTIAKQTEHLHPALLALAE